MAFGAFAGGVAQGLQSGMRLTTEYEQLREAKAAADYLAQQRADEAAYKAALQQNAQPAGLQTNEGGFQVTAPDGRQQFYVPTQEAAAAYARNGYSVDTANPRTYQEVNAGSRNLGQYAGNEDPAAAGLMQQYNAPGAAADRASALALQYARPQEAAAWNQLGNAPMIRQLAQAQLTAASNQNALAPGQQELQGLQLDVLKKHAAVGELTSNFLSALNTGDTDEISRIINESHPHESGHQYVVSKDDKGGFSVSGVDADGKPLGKTATYKSALDFAGKVLPMIDPDKAYQYIEDQRKQQADDNRFALMLEQLKGQNRKTDAYIEELKSRSSGLGGPIGMSDDGTKLLFNNPKSGITEVKIPPGYSQLFRKATGDVPEKDPQTEYTSSSGTAKYKGPQSGLMPWLKENDPKEFNRRRALGVGVGTPGGGLGMPPPQAAAAPSRGLQPSAAATPFSFSLDDLFTGS